MRWWGSNPQSVTGGTVNSAAFFTIILLSSPSAPQFLLPFSGSFIPFLPSPRPIPYHPPSFNCRRRLSLSLHQLLTPHLAWSQSERQPGWCPCLPASTAHLRCIPLPGSPRSFSCDPVSAFPCLVVPPFPSSTCAIRYLSAPGFSRPGVPSSL